jgi:iron complex outermembrane recepter protein
MPQAIARNVIWAIALLFLTVRLPGADANAPKRFDIPAGKASITLGEFARQSGIELLYSSSMIDGVKTRPVRGDFTPRKALEQMLGGTDLVVMPGRSDGVLVITRARTAEDNLNIKKKTT